MTVTFLSVWLEIAIMCKFAASQILKIFGEQIKSRMSG